MSTAKGLRSKKAATASRREANARKDTIVVDSSNEDHSMKLRAKTVSVATTTRGRDDHSATISISSFNADRPPPSSLTDLTTEPTTIRRSDTLPLHPDTINDEPGDITLQSDETFLIQRTPPRSALNALPYVSGGVSPTRTMSLPAQSPGSINENFNGLVSPHRATSAMAKRSGNKGNKSTRKLATTSTPKRASPTKTPSKRLRKIAEDEEDQDITTSNPIESTSSMPELSRRSPINFLRDLIHNESSQQPRSIVRATATQKEPQSEPGAQSESAEDETQSSNVSKEQRFYARYGPAVAHKEVFRPVTQPAAIHNPPGVFVNSQTQSDHPYAGGDETQDVLDGHTGSLKRVATTLVAGTPSTVSEDSQPESNLDLTQIYSAGRALFQHESPEAPLIPTQSVVATQEYVPTQAVNESGEEILPTQPIVASEEADIEPGTQSVVGTLEISPRKPGRYYTSSSGSSSIPGLNMTQDTSAPQFVTERKSKSSGSRMAAPPVPSPKKPTVASPTKQQRSPEIVINSRTRPRVPSPGYMNPSRGLVTTSASRQVHTAAHADPGSSKILVPGASPLKRNPLTRRKSPAAIDRVIFEKVEVKVARDLQTIPIDPTSAETQVVETAFDLPSKGHVKSDESGKFRPVAAPDSVLAPPKRNPLTRRKSPVSFGDFLFQREQMNTYREREETVPLEDNRAATEELETQPVRVPTAETFAKSDTGLEKPEETVLSEAGDSEVMETDEEVQVHPTWPATLTKAIGRAQYIESPEDLVDSPEDDRTLVTYKQEEVGIGRRDAHFKDSTLQRKSNDTQVTQHNVTVRNVQNRQPRNVRKRKAAAVEELSEEQVSSSDDEDDASDYQPQPTQTQFDPLEREAVLSDEESQPVSKPPKPTTSSRRGTGKRWAQNPGERNVKRLCRRDITPKLPPAPVSPVVSLKKKTAEMGTPASKQPPPVNSSPVVADHSISMISTTRTSRRSTRGHPASKAISSAQVGHLVFVKDPETTQWFPGYTVVRIGKSWEIRLCDDRKPMVLAEPKFIRIGELQVDDPIYVSTRPGGDDYGPAVVIGVDQMWEEARHVKVKIGTEGEETYVPVQYIFVYEQHISSLWDGRKVTHEDLEKTDGQESIQQNAPTSLARTASIIPTPSNSTVIKPSTSYRSSLTSSRKIFNGIGFLLTSCGLEDTKLIKDRGGHIYESWLNAFQFDGGIERVKGGHERWIRKVNGDSGRRRSSTSSDSSPIKWIGNDNEEGVKSIFVVAGKVIMTAKILIALSFGIPCVSTKWLEACGSAGERVDWIPYLLPSHTISSPLSLLSDVPPAQSPDYQWGSEVYNDQYILDNILSHAPLSHHRILFNKTWVLCIAPDCVSHLRADTEEEAASCQAPFVYCCLAMGAQNVEAVDQYIHATDPKLTKYDLIVIADTISEKIHAHDRSLNALATLLKKAMRNEKLVMNQSDIKMSIACGKLMKTSEFDLH